MTRWQRLFDASPLDREIDAELRDHVERQIADYRRQGLTRTRGPTSRVGRLWRRRAGGRGVPRRVASSASSTNSCRTCATASASCGRARCLRAWPCCRWPLASAPSPRSTRSSMRCCSRRCPFALQRSSCCSPSAWALATASRSRQSEFRRLGDNDALAGLCAFRPWPGFRLDDGRRRGTRDGAARVGQLLRCARPVACPRPAAAGRRRPRARRAAGRRDQLRLLAASLQR